MTRFPFEASGAADRPPTACRMSQMVPGVTYRPTEQIEVIQEGLALARLLVLGPSDRFRCEGGIRSSYWFQRRLRWGGLRQVCGLLNGEPVTLRADRIEQAVWQPINEEVRCESSEESAPGAGAC